MMCITQTEHGLHNLKPDKCCLSLNLTEPLNTGIYLLSTVCGTSGKFEILHSNWKKEVEDLFG